MSLAAPVLGEAPARRLAEAVAALDDVPSIGALTRLC